MNVGLEEKQEIMYLTYMVLNSWMQSLKKKEMGNLGFRSEPKEKAEQANHQRTWDLRRAPKKENEIFKS